MPRVFSIDMLDEQPTDDMLDDDDYDPLLVAPSAFQYLPAPEFGPSGEVRVAVRPEQAGKIDNGPTAYERYTGRREQLERPELELKYEVAAARIAEAMAALGAARAYVLYDGGNDEGFAWFKHCVMKDGSMRDADGIAADLQAAGLKPELPTYGDHARAMRNALDDHVAGLWAASLLGRGYGTGEYVMYGALWVDLETGVVTDDRDPAPIVTNIRFKAE